MFGLKLVSEQDWNALVESGEAARQAAARLARRTLTLTSALDYLGDQVKEQARAAAERAAKLAAQISDLADTVDAIRKQGEAPPAPTAEPAARRGKLSDRVRRAAEEYSFGIPLEEAANLKLARRLAVAEVADEKIIDRLRAGAMPPQEEE